MNESQRAALRQRLNQPGLLVAPGVFDMVSLRLADTFGFDALYMTGYGTVASHMGLPDAGLATYSDMVGRVTAMAGMARTPLIADADTGYGGLLNMRHTIRGYEAAGAAAIQLEDQEFPKKCGHTPGRRVIPMEDMVRKIRVAVEARTDPNFLIIARTDARTSLGLDEALRRAEAYAKAGADILFVESPESEEEMRRMLEEGGFDVIATEAPGGLGEVIGAEGEELGRLGDVAGRQCRTRQLDHRPDRELQGAAIGFGNVGQHGRGLVDDQLQLLDRADERDHDLRHRMTAHPLPEARGFRDRPHRVLVGDVGARLHRTGHQLAHRSLSRP